MSATATKPAPKAATEAPRYNLRAIKEFFGMTLAEMKAEFVTLPAGAKAQINDGIADGTLTY